MKRKLFAISLICVFMLTGCTKAIELTEDQDALVAEAAAADASAHALDGGGEFVEGLIPVLKQMEGGALGRPGAVARKFSEGLDQTLDGWGKTDAHGLGFAGEKLILMSAGLPK